MEDKKSNVKLVWYILFAVITVILCYLFTVVYFYFIAPNNISLKLGLWPFVPDQTIGEMYLDATVEINFKVKDDVSFEEVEKSVVGVNVRSDGFIIAPCNEFRACSDTTDIKILTNSGKVFAGLILYQDKDYNLTVLKCESIDGSQEKVSIPFVKISNTLDTLNSDKNILATASPLKSKNVWTGKIIGSSSSNLYSETTVGSNYVVDFMIENCYEVSLKTSSTSYTGGAIFDKTGGFLGLSLEGTTENGNNFVMPVSPANYFLTDVIKNYKANATYTNSLVESVVGFDRVELDIFMTVSQQNEVNREYFYFNNSWKPYTDDVIYYSTSDVLGFYVYEDFVYNETKILDKNSVIASIRVGFNTYEIDTKTDLLKALYKLKSGQKATIYYYLIDSLGSYVQTVSFTV